MKTRNKLITLLFLVAVHSLAHAAQLGDAIDAVTNDIKADYPKLRNLLYAICAFSAVFGTYKVFTKFQNQEQDTTKAIAIWAGAFIFSGAAAIVIQTAFIDQ